ncbi:hypothetical protein [Anaeroselena agilis]|uniref:Uncharacterized protein n=1 Tax=Anaeroselena agilis TaxID=3063788 RepID=A0ABU3NTZ7_9FIRM|nr:hypothetical protein [Selenomonadales bacterium 4137-cl]
MRTFVKKMAQCLADIGTSCPYTIVGKKIVQSARGKQSRTDKVNNDRENELAARVKTGRNVTLIGIFCPFFWFALFSGAPANEVYFNAVHSGIVVAIGLAIMLKTRMDLTEEQRRHK